MGLVMGHNKSSGISAGTPTFSVEGMDPFVQAMAQASAASSTYFDGDKFFGGFGGTKSFITDYWTLRERSNQLFDENLYARGLIRRLITNEINTGLSLEATPIGELVGLNDDAVTDWSENVENRFKIWSDNPFICDYKQRSTFGKLQRECRQEALVGGDVLVVLRKSKVNNLSNVDLVRGSLIQTPLDVKPRAGNVIKHGVELDSRGRHVAFYVTQKDGKSKRVPAFGEKTKRRIAWLVYGTDKRVDEVRGQPLLSLILQSLKEIDRYRDAAQRKAVINSMLAMFIKKDAELMGTKAVTGGAIRSGAVNVVGSDNSTRSFNISKHIPGTVIEELQKGETPEVHSTAGTDINFSAFEGAIVSGIAWANEIPPEILMLAFSSNYSASRTAINEFKMYLNKSRSDRADEFDKPIYIEWLIREVLLGKIDAPGLFESLLDSSQYDIFGAWVQSDWAGAIKPNVDLKKEVAGYKMMIEGGLITNDRAARELSGTKFSKNMQRQKQENKLKVAAIRPFLELEKEFPNSRMLTGIMATDNITIDSIDDKIKEALEDYVPASS